mmetsp:Transcript_10412/g.18136  ORF Transcript_10412/g.18136 Transcript_10412/m.18136 type:complete len:369 (-) Transcript_10412:70-1176(-)
MPASTVCRHFLQGRCNFGDACSFSHEAEPPPPSWARPPPALTRQVCRHFMEGRCTYGDACNFVHPDQEDDDWSAQSTLVEAPAEPALQKPQAWTRAASPSAVEGPICRHFLEGKCTYGDACRFSHSEGGGDMVSRSSPVSFWAPPRVVPPPASRRRPPSQDDRPICRHFLQGRCSAGDECNFSHEVDFELDPTVAAAFGAPVTWAANGSISNNIQNSADHTRSTCRHFLEGRCIFGDVCRFSHEGSGPMPVEDTTWTATTWHYGPARNKRSKPLPSPNDDRTCRHFMAGRCTFGDMCAFVHPGVNEDIILPGKKQVVMDEWDMSDETAVLQADSAEAGTVETDRSVCRNFLEGKCTYGNSCRFSHGGG